MQVTTIAADDGTLGVFVGRRPAARARRPARTPLAVAPDEYDPQKVTIGIDEGSGNVRSLPAELFGGGSHRRPAALPERRPRRRAQPLGQIAASLAGAVNQQQALGLDLLQPSRRRRADLRRRRAACAAGVDATHATPSGAFIAAPTLAIADASQLQASDYELRADPSGAPGV